MTDQGRNSDREPEMDSSDRDPHGILADRIPDRVSPRLGVKSERNASGDNNGTSGEYESDFPCMFCFYTAKTSRGLKLHMSFKHEEQRNSVQCPHCEEIFEKVELLENHIEMCASIHDFRCTMCKHSFKSSKGLKIHISQKHSVKCPHCDKVCDSPQRLDEHIEVCPHFRAFQCDFCTYTFKTDKGLKSHMSRKHGDQLLNVKCPHCQAFFEHARLLDIHMRVYHGKNFSCMKCKEQFMSARLLRQHMEDAHGNPACLYCGIEFEHKKLMMFHMNAHHKDKLLSQNGLENHDSENSLKEPETKKMKKSEKEVTSEKCEDMSNTNMTSVINYKASVFKSASASQSTSNLVSVSIIPAQPNRDPVLPAKPVCSILKGSSTPPKTSSPKAVTFSQDTKTVTIPPASSSSEDEPHGINVPVITSSQAAKSSTTNTVDNVEDNCTNRTEKSAPRITIHCPECRQKFTNPDLFKMHYQVYHKVPTCKVCGLKFDHVNLMRIHYNYCHNSENDLLYCHHCDKSFSTKTELLDHLVEHHNSEKRPELAEKGSEAKSDEDSDSEEKLEPEVDVVIKLEAGEEIPGENCYEDGNLGPNMCPLEGSEPVNSEEEEPRNENDFVPNMIPRAKPHCQECDMIFEHVNLLKIHLKSYHSENLSMSCHNCSKLFRSRAEYLDHLIAFQNNSGHCEGFGKKGPATTKLKNVIGSKAKSKKVTKAEPKKRGRKPKLKKTESASGSNTDTSLAMEDEESISPSHENAAPVHQPGDPESENLIPKVTSSRRRRRSIAKIAQQKKAKMAVASASTGKRGRKRYTSSTNLNGKKKAKSLNVDSEGDECSLKCQHCGVKFEHTNLLKIHIKAYHNSTTQMLNCNRCGVKFSNKSEYLNHLIMHGAESQSEEALGCRPNMSPGKNKGKESLNKNMEVVQGGEENTTSISTFLAGTVSDSDEDEVTKTDEDLCRVTKLIENAANNFSDVLKPFDGLSADETMAERQPKARGRKKIIIKPDQKYPCIHCDQVFDHCKLLTIHTKAYHNTGSCLVCYNCDVVFEDKQTFLNHIVSHANDKFYQPGGKGNTTASSSGCDPLPDHENVDNKLTNYSQVSSDDDDVSSDADDNEDGYDFQQDDADAEDLDLSISSDSSQPERMPCPICGKSFPSRRRLEVHMFNHAATNEEGRYLCSVCNKAFENPRKLETHFRSHSGYKPYVCPDCGKSFSYHSSYHYHKLTHAEDKPCKCPLCGKGFIQTRYLRSHLRSHKVGSPEKTSSDEPGQKTVTTEPGEDGSSLKKNKDSTCLNLVPDSDDISQPLEESCPSIKGTESNDTCHLIKQEPCDEVDAELSEEQLTERLTCAICNEVFKNNEELQSHIVCHVGERPYQCQYCSKSFTAYSSWYIHTRTHTGNKPHVCQYCGKRFLHPTGLKRHIRYHTGERPYSCTHCSSGFADSGALVSHMRSHTGSKPFQCKECGRSYTQRSSLKFHMQYHHVLSMISGNDETGEDQEDSSKCFTTVVVHSDENSQEGNEGEEKL